MKSKYSIAFDSFIVSRFLKSHEGLRGQKVIKRRFFCFKIGTCFLSTKLQRAFHQMNDFRHDVRRFDGEMPFLEGLYHGDENIEPVFLRRVEYCTYQAFYFGQGFFVVFIRFDRFYFLPRP